MTTPAVSPVVPFYAETQPYITNDEYRAAPTGVSLSQLIPGNSNAAAQDAALATLIRSASSYADSLCYQILAATADIEAGEYRVRDGMLHIPVAYTPIIAVTGVSLGTIPGQLSALTDLSGIWFGPKVIRVPAGSCFYNGSAFRSGYTGRQFAQVTYVNGYANTTLAADCNAGDTSVQVASTLGLFPGVPLTVYDDANGATEAVSIATGYTYGSTTVPLVSPLLNNHTSGVAFSAMPRSIKQAVIALTTHLVKTRGAESFSFSRVGDSPGATQSEPGASEEYDLAVDLLHPFRRVA